MWDVLTWGVRWCQETILLVGRGSVLKGSFKFSINHHLLTDDGVELLGPCIAHDDLPIAYPKVAMFGSDCKHIYDWDKKKDGKNGTSQNHKCVRCQDWMPDGRCSQDLICVLGQGLETRVHLGGRLAGLISKGYLGKYDSLIWGFFFWNGLNWLKLLWKYLNYLNMVVRSEIFIRYNAYRQVGDHINVLVARGNLLKVWCQMWWSFNQFIWSTGLVVMQVYCFST